MHIMLSAGEKSKKGVSFNVLPGAIMGGSAPTALDLVLADPGHVCNATGKLIKPLEC